jgi:N-methylhydantoinase A/oxoprolinase/acetone carboxylase beta subunit
MRYLGQGHEVEAAVPLGNLSAESLPMITASFEAAYRALYHRLPQGVPIEALNWRVKVAGPDPKIALTSRAGPGRASLRPPSVRAGLTDSATTARRGSVRAIKGARRAYFAEAGGFAETPVYDRYALATGMTLTGPAIVEERESTAVIGPGGRARVDAGLALIVEMTP